MKVANAVKTLGVALSVAAVGVCAAACGTGNGDGTIQSNGEFVEFRTAVVSMIEKLGGKFEFTDDYASASVTAKTYASSGADSAKVEAANIARKYIVGMTLIIEAGDGYTHYLKQTKFFGKKISFVQTSSRSGKTYTTTMLVNKTDDGYAAYEYYESDSGYSYGQWNIAYSGKDNFNYEYAYEMGTKNGGMTRKYSCADSNGAFKEAYAMYSNGSSSDATQLAITDCEYSSCAGFEGELFKETKKSDAANRMVELNDKFSFDEKVFKGLKKAGAKLNDEQYEALDKKYSTWLYQD